jgi:hypothetical protein
MAVYMKVVHPRNFGVLVLNCIRSTHTKIEFQATKRASMQYTVYPRQSSSLVSKRFEILRDNSIALIRQ